MLLLDNFYCCALIIPHAILEPAFPVFKLPASPPFPKSSSPLCMTIASPTTFAGESGSRLIILSCMTTSVGCSSEFVNMLPKSPTCLSRLFGAPWFFYKINEVVQTTGAINFRCMKF